jgi:tetratricopeptide (TPR) repeat protein
VWSYLEQTVASNSGAGTIAYIAPECFRGQLTQQSDQYSLAVTYYHLRAGELLFTGDQAQVMYAHLELEPELSHLPSDEATVLARALSKDAGKRWSNCKGFVNELIAAADFCESPRAADLPDADWSGKIVLLKGRRPVAIRRFDNDHGEILLAPLRGVNYRIIEKCGPLLKVNEDGIEGWFDKSDAVTVEDAVEYFTRRIRNQADDIQAHIHRAVAWKLNGDLDLAIAGFTEVLQLDASCIAAYINRGNAWTRKQLYDKAMQDYDEAIRLDPDYWVAYFTRGEAWMGKKNYDKAISDFDRSITLESTHPCIYRKRGLAWWFKEEYTKAIADLSEAIRLDPRQSHPYVDRALAWE